jgi:polysaccharide biosynthesis/export protein
MKKFILLSTIAFGMLYGITSCRSPKEFTYFKDTKSNQHIRGISSVVQEYKIKPYDNLYIFIKTIDPEVNELFDANRSANGASGGTTQDYGDYVSQYINGYQVNSSGTISLPILGTIEVAGLTLKEIQEKILNKSLEFLKEPRIKVKLLSFKVNVSGEVRNPGVYYSYNEKLSILEAISMANGVTDNAKLKKVLVIRPTDSGGADTYYIDLTRKDLLASKAYYLQPNDMVYVKPGYNKTMELNTVSYSLFLSTVTTVLLIINLLK